MTLPNVIRINLPATFPSTVKGSGPIVISKANGIWTVSIDIKDLATTPVGSDPSTKLLLIYDTISNTFQQTTIAALNGIFSTRIVTAAGDVAVLANDRVILMNQAVPQAVNILLPASSSRNGVPLTVKDYAGVAGSFMLTFVTNGTDIVDGDGAVNAAVNNDFQAITLNPITGGWWLG